MYWIYHFFFPGNIRSLPSVSSVENDKHLVTLETYGLVFENAFEEFSCRLFLTTFNIKETPYTYWFLVRVRNTLSFLSLSITITSHPCLCPTHTSWKSAMPISKLEKQGHSSWKRSCKLTPQESWGSGLPWIRHKFWESPKKILLTWISTYLPFCWLMSA